MASSTNGEPPFVGLSAFEPTQGWLFFGRDRDARLIAANVVSSPCTIVYGPSGVGKSSLLNAAVVPALIRKPECDVCIVREWRNIHANQLDTWFAALEKRRGSQNGQRAILILDQLEEYFHYWPNDHILPSWIKRATGFRVPLRLAFSIREEALSRLDVLGDDVPGLFENLYRLQHLDRSTGRHAIMGPVGAFNDRLDVKERIQVEDPLVDEVLNQVAVGKNSAADIGISADVRPHEDAIETTYLQLVMLRLWNEEQRLGSRTLRRQTLEALGGAKVVFQQHLDQALAMLPGPVQADAAEVMRFMATAGGTKRACTVEELHEYTSLPKARIDAVVNALAHQESRILRVVPAGDHGASAYELFHDVLVGPAVAWRRRFVVARAKRDAELRSARLLRLVAVLILFIAGLGALSLYVNHLRGQADSARAQAIEEKRRADDALTQAVTEKMRADFSKTQADSALARLQRNLDFRKELLSRPRLQVPGLLRSAPPESRFAFSVEANELDFKTRRGQAIYGFTATPRGPLRGVEVITYYLNRPDIISPLLTTGPRNDFSAYWEGVGCIESAFAIFEWNSREGSEPITVAEFSPCKIVSEAADIPTK